MNREGIAVYRRSTEGQSFDAQHDAVRGFCREHGITIREEIHATGPTIPGDARETLEREKPDCIVVSDFSRLGRRPEDVRQFEGFTVLAACSGSGGGDLMSAIDPIGAIASRHFRQQEP